MKMMNTSEMVYRHVVDNRSGRLKRAVDYDPEGLLGTAIEMEVAVWHQDGYLSPWAHHSVRTEVVEIVAFPEGHLWAEARDALGFATGFVHRLPATYGAWEPWVTRERALWAADELRIADGEWSVTLAEAYRLVGVSPVWRETLIPPTGAAELEALGVTPDRYLAGQHGLAAHPRSAESMARALRPR